MIYKITVKYKFKEELFKIIKTSLNEKIKILKNNKQITICLTDKNKTRLYEFNEDEVYGYEIARIS